jgi:folate-binding Fe-S cluster repair protein YgfZ
MPNEARLDDVFSATKGCYLGQEVVVRLRDRGQVNRKLIGLRLPGVTSDQDLPAAGTKLAHATRPSAGHITSVVRSPRFGTIALGYAHRSVWDVGTELLLVNAAGEPTGQTAVVTALPFPA